ncbi:MAG: TonB-dependent siderophore receptor [Rhizobacter sp.]|nr:TonB-dependent siderophore receptor [Rhizobacter sp.]
MHNKNCLPREPRRHALALLALATFGAACAHAQVAAPAEAASAPEATTLPAVRVKAATAGVESYGARKSTSATGLNQTLRDTPQSVSVLTRTLMDDFKLDSIDRALTLATGVSVEKIETDRSYYTARGFDIVNFQVDGIGMPLVYGLRHGDLDTAVYERVDVVRGANGLMNGVGSPSAAVNFVRKRPTRELRASAGLSLGSWNDRRVDAEVSGPLNASGSLRALLVVAAQDRDSYLDRYHHRKSVFNGVLEADLGEHTTLAVGHTQQKNRPRGTMWGALPLFYSDGTPTDYDVSTSTAPDWTSWNTDTDVSHAELRHDFSNGWQATTRFMHTEVTARGKLFYVYGTPDRSTGNGLATWPSLYDLDQREDVLDLRASGPYSLGGRQHELIVGASSARSSLRDQSAYGPIGDPLPDLATWNGDFPEPVWGAPVDGSDFRDRQHSLYAATRLNPVDPLKLIVGANATWLKSSGTSYGDPRARDEHQVVPYLGVVFDLSEHYSLYASHTAIFKPQSELGADLQPLAPVKGRAVEAGLKGEWLGGRLNASVAVFKSKQDNLAAWSRTEGVNEIYEGVDTRSQGVELELSGALTPRVQVQGGYTQLSIKDESGTDVRTFTPRRQLSFATTWRALDALKLGATLRWRDDAHRDEAGGVVIRQPAYALLDLMARYDFNDHWSARLNLNNVTNEKYVNSLYWSQGYYGEPRSAHLSVSWTH